MAEWSAATLPVEFRRGIPRNTAQHVLLYYGVQIIRSVQLELLFKCGDYSLSCLVEGIPQSTIKE